MIPRVSKICEMFYPCAFYEDEATERGTYYHEFIASALSEPDIMEDFYFHLGQEPFLRPLADWLTKEVTHIHEIEQQRISIVSPFFSGRPDSLIETRSYGLINTDWKSGKAQTESHKMQSAAYERLMHASHPNTPCLRLYLGNTGRVDVKRTENPSGYQAAFLAGVRFWEAKQMVRGL